MPRFTPSSNSHDPFWDLDGEGARRSRSQRRFARYATWLIALLVVAVVATRLPAVDTDFLINGGGRPILVGAILALLCASVLLAVGKMRTPNHG